MARAVDSQKLRAQFFRAHISVSDFEEALSYLLVKPGTTGAIIPRALMTAAIVAYARSFTKNETDPSAPATPSVALRLAKLFSSEEKQLHKRLLTMRDTAVAHSSFETRRGQHHVTGARSYLVGNRVFDLHTQDIDRMLFVAMCEKLRAACMEARDNLNARIHAASAA